MNDGDAPDARVLVRNQVQDGLVQVLVKIVEALLTTIEDGVQYVDGAYNDDDVSGDDVDDGDGNDDDDEDDNDNDNDDDDDHDDNQPGQKGST